MTGIQFSPLESALLTVFHSLNAARGFPPPDQFRILRRENTGAGRYVDVQVSADTQLEDGYIDLGGRFIEMDGIPHGLMAVMRIKDHRPTQIEIAVYGNHSWNGEETNWSIKE